MYNAADERGEAHVPCEARPEAAVPQMQHKEPYTGREERCVQVHRDRKQVRVTTGGWDGGTTHPPD